MKFDTPATTNPIDRLKVVGKPVDRIDGKLKTTGTAPYANDRRNVIPNQAIGYVLGAGIAKGRITAMDVSRAKAAPEDLHEGANHKTHNAFKITIDELTLPAVLSKAKA